jgi:hypothetical protein
VQHSGRLPRGATPTACALLPCIGGGHADEHGGGARLYFLTFLPAVSPVTRETACAITNVDYNESFAEASVRRQVDAEVDAVWDQSRGEIESAIVHNFIPLGSVH